MIIREAHAVWDGNIESGSGTISVGQNPEGRFDHGTRFTKNETHNPETLAAGALAGCYAMSLANVLAGHGFTPSEVNVATQVVLDKKVDGQPFIPTVNISARAQLNNIGDDKFLSFADEARSACPMANLFAGAEVSLDANVIGG